MNRNPAESINQHQQTALLPIQLFNKSMSTIIEARLANIEQRAQRLMSFSITISDNNFF